MPSIQLNGLGSQSIHVTGLFLYPLKVSENCRFSDVFRGHRNRPVARNGLKNVVWKTVLGPRVTTLQRCCWYLPDNPFLTS